MLNTKLSLNQIDAIAVQELREETSATIQGGAALKLYDTNNFDQLLGSFDYGGKKSLIHNDMISSIIVTEGEWRLYEHSNYKGYGQTFGRGRHVLPSKLNNKVSSFQKVG